MPISFVGSTTQDPAAAVTTLTSAMPAGVQTGDLVLFAILTNSTTIPAAPTGYTQVATGTATAIGLGVWYKFAANSSEPAPSTTQAINRATSSVLVFRGVHATPIDVAAGTSTTGTTAVTVPARTPLNAESWPIAVGSMLTSATNTTTWSSTNLTLDQASMSNVAGSNNPAFVVGHFASWTSGAFTPVITKSATSTRTLGTHFVLRAAAASAAGRVRRMSKRR